MTLNCIKSLVLAIITLSVTSYANPLHDFASKGDADGLAEYIREKKPLLEEFLQADASGETPLEVAMRTRHAGIIEALTRTQAFLFAVRGFGGQGLVHPVHAYVMRGDAWGFTLYLTYFQVTRCDLMNDRHGRSIFEIAREAGNPEMMNLVRETMQNNAETAFSPLREIGNDHTYAANPQAGTGAKEKEEDDVSAATLTLDSEGDDSHDENTNSDLFGSDGNGLFFNLEGDDASLRASLTGFLSPRAN